MSRLLMCVLAALSASACSSTDIIGTNAQQSDAAPGSAPSDDAHYQLGKSQLAAGQLGPAIDTFEGALARNPNSVPILNGLAIAFAKAGRSDLAEHYFSRALALDPQSSVTLNNVAYFHSSRDVPANAIADAKPATPAGNGSAVKTDAAPSPATALEQETASAASAQSVSPQPEENPAPSQPMQKTASAASLATATNAPSDERRESKPVADTNEAENLLSVRVSNGIGVHGLAAQTSHYLSQYGVHVGVLTNERNFDHRYSVIFYNPGLQAFAAKMSEMLPMHPRVVAANRGSGQVELILGADAVVFADRFRSVQTGEAATAGKAT